MDRHRRAGVARSPIARPHATVLPFAVVFLLVPPLPAQTPDPYLEARLQMVREQIASRRWADPVTDTAVLRAMRTVPRHRFVPPELLRLAYADRPLPIGYGQTISQPYIVAAMTQLLELEPGDNVLEIGTGSGYQAAVLAEITDRVYTIEIVEPLARSGRERLEALGYESVTVREGDGYYGWREVAPFDAIVVTAAASHIPPPLVEQLKPDGRMVIPVGAPLQTQALMLVNKRADGSVVQRNMGPVRFVPLTRRK
ncbi:MAG: protein-L-isoaspartate(D-aspartate) O-methyltransferase [Gemmatimonadota bacterium]